MTSRRLRFYHIVTNVVLLISFAAGICSGFSSFPDGTPLESIAFGNGVFVAVGYIGAIFVSSDGITWNESISGTTSTIKAVAFGNNRFVAVDYDGGILWSSDGVTWSKQETYYFDDINDITFGDNLFVAVGRHFAMRADDYTPILTSPDGKEWTACSTGVIGYFNYVAYGNNRFYTSGLTAFLTSTDGVTWTRDSVGMALKLFAMTYGNDRWVAIGDGSIYVSTGDSGWTGYSETSVPFDDLYAFEFVNGQFMALSNESASLDGYTSRIWTSTDGAAWTKQTAGPGILAYGVPYGIAYGNEKYVLVGSNGMAASSDDCITWTTTTLLSANNVIAHRLSNSMSGRPAIRMDHGTVSVSTPARKTSRPAIARLFNVAGKTVFSTSVIPKDGEAHFRIGDIPSGMYMLKLIDQDGMDVSTPFTIAR